MTESMGAPESPTADVRMTHSPSSLMMNSPSSLMMDVDNVPASTAAGTAIGALAKAIEQLSAAMKENPEHVDVPKHWTVLDSAAKRLLQACSMIEHRGRKHAPPQEGGKVPDKVTAEMAAKHGVGFGKITPIGVANLKSRFEQLDTDESGGLSIPEITRMLAQLELYASQRTLDQILKPMTGLGHDVDSRERDDISQIEWADFIHGMNEVITAHYDVNDLQVHLPDVPLRKLQYEQLKVIAVAGLAMSTIIYFRFMLVPMTMAYFLTFVLGPIIDFVSQRPLVCLGRVYCKINKLPYDRALVQWRTKHPYRPMPHPNDVEYPFDDSARNMCYSVPPSKSRGTLVELFTVGQMPFPLALMMMFVIVCATLYVVFAFVQRDLSLVLEDPIFVASLKDVLNGLLDYLKNDMGFILEVSTEELLPPPCFPDNPEWVESYPNHLECERMSNISAVRFEGTVEEFMVFLAPYISLANDWVLTIMLCLYLLAARSGRTEYDHHRAKHAVGELSIMEKIEVMNKNYVLLKTKLSALTGGLVGLILGFFAVKLWFIWAMLTFMLNFIPNVGSMIAMLLPIPIIIVDEELTMPVKIAAFFLPACVQLYVGNVLEPMVFGKSLNLTALSVLVALVLWSSVWGMPGAILSVPLLGVMKIGLDAADLPLAKMLLVVIREDSDIDEHAQMADMLKQLPSYQMEHTYSMQGGDDFAFETKAADDDFPNPLANNGSRSPSEMENSV